MTDSQKEQRRTALAWSGGVCEVCGRPLRDGQPQGAHRKDGMPIDELHMIAAEYNIILKEV